MTTKLMGLQQFDPYGTTEAHIVAIKAAGANTVTLPVYITGNSDTNYWYAWDNNTMHTVFVNVAAWCHSHNVKVMLSCFGVEDQPPEGYANMQAKVVYDAEEKADWINGYKTIIAALQPDVVNVMNEPMAIADASWYPEVSQNQYLVDLKNFYLDCIDAYLTVKADLQFIIAGSPWNDASSLLTAPRVDVSRPSVPILYSCHRYYCYNGAYPTWGGFEESYWTDELATAKTELYATLDSWHGLAACRAAGVTVILDEAGGHIENPNVEVYAQDLFDYAATYNMGVLWAYWYNTAIRTDDFYGCGILDSYSPVSYNAVGSVWAANMPRSTLVLPVVYSVMMRKR